jgi:hypothetical protein
MKKQLMPARETSFSMGFFDGTDERESRERMLATGFAVRDWATNRDYEEGYDAGRRALEEAILGGLRDQARVNFFLARRPEAWGERILAEV